MDLGGQRNDISREDREMWKLCMITTGSGLVT